MDQESDETSNNDEEKKALNASAAGTTYTHMQAEKSRWPYWLGISLLILLAGFIGVRHMINSGKPVLLSKTIETASIAAEQMPTENSAISFVTTDTTTAEITATDTASPTATETSAPTATNTVTPVPTDTAAPTPTYTALPTSTATAEPVVFIENGHAEFGDEITFGRYEQDNIFADGAEPLVWRVLTEKDGKVLLLSKYGLDYKKYNETAANMTWENCDLRAWLNDEFMSTAFNEAEAALIQEVENINSRNPVYYTEGGNNTLDRVFLLSIDEINLYLPVMTDRLCVTSAYLDSTPISTRDNGYVQWWLRSPGDSNEKAALVSYGGIMGQDGNDIYISHAIRPALWLDLSAQLDQ